MRPVLTKLPTSVGKVAEVGSSSSEVGARARLIQKMQTTRHTYLDWYSDGCEECDRYSFAEMVLMEPRGNLDDVWQENWLEMLNELVDTTVKN